MSDCLVPFSLRKAVALVSYLAVESREFSREYLATLLWPETSQSDALADLRRTLSIVRKSIGAAAIIATGSHLAISDACYVDVEDFDTLSASDDPDQLERAMRLYRGSFMEGFVDTRDLVFFVSTSVFCVFLTAVVVTVRRWR